MQILLETPTGEVVQAGRFQLIKDTSAAAVGSVGRYQIQVQMFGLGAILAEWVLGTKYVDIIPALEPAGLSFTAWVVDSNQVQASGKVTTSEAKARVRMLNVRGTGTEYQAKVIVNG